MQVCLLYTSDAEKHIQHCDGESFTGDSVAARAVTLMLFNIGHMFIVVEEYPWHGRYCYGGIFERQHFFTTGMVRIYDSTGDADEA